MTEKNNPVSEKSGGKQDNTLAWIVGIAGGGLGLAIICALCVVVAAGVIMIMQYRSDSQAYEPLMPSPFVITTATPVPPLATAEPSEEPVIAEPTVEEPTPVESVDVIWVVREIGGDITMPMLQEDVVDEFNNTHDDIFLIMDVVAYDLYQDTLAVMVAAGDAPDIVGPESMISTGLPTDQWLDLSGYIEESGFDTSIYNPAVMDIYNLPDQGQIALPYSIYPSAMFYNVDLFDAANLCYPPEHFGEPYCDGDPWDWDKVREIGMLLTLDANGNNATSQNFDPDNIVQYGLTLQWTDARGEAIFVGGNGTVWNGQGAFIPDNWRDAWQWHHDGIWEDHFIMSRIATDEYYSNPFSEGVVAMYPSHSWYFCCIFNEFNWDIGALPVPFDGNITAKTNGSTFFIHKESEHPDAAWEVLSWMLEEKSDVLDEVFSANPARIVSEEEYRNILEDIYYDDFSNVNVGVLIEAQDYPDIPSNETYLPNHSSADETLWDFYTLYQEMPRDMDADIDALESDLEYVFSD
ncbi:MAG: extracellular solute-binding protein [Anaerolineae bacterium]|nr:extracellular solute-binding protein [Anaerolineae bacterium]